MTDDGRFFNHVLKFIFIFFTFLTFLTFKKNSSNDSLHLWLRRNYQDVLWTMKSNRSALYEDMRLSDPVSVFCKLPTCKRQESWEQTQLDGATAASAVHYAVRSRD